MTDDKSPAPAESAVDAPEAPAAVTTPEDTTDTDDQPDDDQEPASAREARYRIRAREAEAERDQLRASVEALQRAEVERLAASMLEKPAALWAGGVELADLLDDNGQIDPGKVDIAAAATAETLGLSPPRRAPKPDRNQGRNYAEPVTPNPWTEAFKAN